MWPMGILFPVDVLNTCTCSKKDLHFVLSLNNGLLIHIHCSSILISNFMKDDSNNNNFLNLYYFPNISFSSVDLYSSCCSPIKFLHTSCKIITHTKVHPVTYFISNSLDINFFYEYM